VGLSVCIRLNGIIHIFIDMHIIQINHYLNSTDMTRMPFMYKELRGGRT
jgi:hypothetical protein